MPLVYYSVDFLLLNDGFVLCLLSFQWIILHESTGISIVITIEVQVDS